jgi:hypothetical protein
MAVALANTSPTLVDVAKRTGADGNILPVVEALQQRNALIQSMVFKEGNTDTGQMVSSRNSLPSVAWVRINEGVPASKSTNDNYTENTGILEGLSSIDVRLAEMNGNSAAFRASEDDAFLAQMANTLEAAFFYESSVANPERILGLSPRLGSTTSKYGAQIIKADTGAAGANQASAWLIGWGDRTVYGISPRGQASGLTMEDMGKQRVLDTNGNPFYKYETLFRWRIGLCVEDYRYLVRIANIDMTRLKLDVTLGGANLVQSMIQAYYQIFDPTAVRLAWYVNRQVGAFLHNQALRQTGAGGTLTVEPTAASPGVFGRPILRALGIPIYVTDALISTEALVV